MNRRALWLSIVAVAAHWQAAFAQVTIPTSTPEYKIIVAKSELVIPADMKPRPKLRWQFDPALSVEKSSTGKYAYITGPPRDEPYRGVLTVAKVVEGELDLVDYAFEFTIEGEEPGPAPTPKPIRDLVTAEQAVELAYAYSDWIEVLTAGVPKTTGAFREAHARDLERRRLTGHGATAAVAKRIDAAIGTEDVDLDTDQRRQKLIAECSKLADEFGRAPDPGPDPEPSPAPIPAAGLHVLIVEETDDRGRIPIGQLAALQSTQVRGYVQGKGGQFRQYDDDPPIADPLWNAARSRPRQSLPWLIVSNGERGGFEGPLPQSVEETLQTIKKFAE
jgi:hypothetical protein